MLLDEIRKTGKGNTSSSSKTQTSNQKSTTKSTTTKAQQIQAADKALKIDPTNQYQLEQYLGQAMNPYGNIDTRLKNAGNVESVRKSRENKVNNSPVLNAISDANLELLGGMTTGFGNLLKSGSTAAQTIGGMTGNKNLVNNARQFAQDLGVEQAQQNVRDQSLFRQSDNGVLNTVGDVLSGVGNMVPMLTVGNLTGSNALGLGTMAAGVFGGKGEEAINRLSSDGDFSKADALRALGYGAGNAALEVATELLPIGEGVGKLFGQEGVGRVMPWQVGRNGNFLADVAGEAAEEMVSSALDPFLEPLANNDVQNAQQYYNEAMRNSFGNLPGYLGDIGYSGLTGALTSAVMGGPNVVMNNITNQQSQSYEPSPVVEQTPHTLVDDSAPKPTVVQETQPSVEASFTDTTGMTTEPITLTQAFDNIRPIEETLNTASDAAIDWENDPIRTEINNARQRYDAYGADYRNYTGESWTDALMQRAIDKENARRMARTQTGDATTQPAQTAQELFEQEAQDIPEEYREQIIDDVMDDMTDNLNRNTKVNRTYERISNGENVGPVEFSDDTVESVKGRVDAQDESTRYIPFAKGEELESAAYRIATKGADAIFNEVQNFDTTPKKTGKGLGRLLSDYITTDYATLQATSNAEALMDYYETEFKRLYEEASQLGNIVKEETKDGIQYKLMNGETEVESDIPAQLKELTTKRDLTLQKLIPIFHNAGTTLNMAAALKQLSPSAQLQSIQKGLDAFNEELRQKFPNQFKTGEMQDIKIPAELEEAFLLADTQEQRQAVKEQIADYAAQQVRHTGAEKLRTYRYVMMLFNPTTIIRNDVGNTMMRGMATMKDGVRYGLEAVLKKMGFVQQNNLDLGRKADKALYNYANTALGTLTQDFADARDTGNTRQALRDLGYDGALAKSMNQFVGDEFSLNNEPVMRQRTATEFANVAKRNGWQNQNGTLVDADGKAVSQETIRQTINDSYNNTRRQFLSSSDLQQVNAAEGEYGRASISKEAKQTAEAIYDLLGNENLDNKYLSQNSFSDSDFARAVADSQNNKVFDDSKLTGKAMNKASEIINLFMNAAKFWGDAKFVKDNYVTYMARALSAQGLTASVDGDTITLTKDGKQLSRQQTNNVLGELNAKAMQEALINTYREINPTADALNSISRNGGIPGFLMDAVMPFTRTPMNILRRSVEYSPAGLVSSIAKINQVQKGNISAEQFLQGLAKGTTGTGALLLGMLLKNLGFLRGAAPGKDDDEKAYESANGIKDYQLVLPNGDSISLDWAAPSITPFLLGAQLSELGDSFVRKDDEGNASFLSGLTSEALTQLGTLVQPVLDTTYLSGLKDSLGSLSKGDFGNATITTVQTYLNQLTPTLANKISNIFDDYRVSTYSDNVADSALRTAVSRLRFLDYMYAAINDGERYLQPQLDIDGNPIPNEDNGMGMFGRALNNLVFPWTYNRNTMDDADRELERLHQTTGQSAVLPEQQFYYNGRKFTPKERTEYNEYFLGNFQDAVREFINSPQYKEMDDEERATVIRSMSSHYKAKATGQFLSMAGDEKSLLTERDAAADEAEKLGISVPQFYTLATTKSATDGNGDSIRNSKAMAVRAALEANGSWDKVYNAWVNGTFDPTKLGLNKTVLKWDDEEFNYNYQKLMDGRLKSESEEATAKKEAKDAQAKANGTYYSSKKSSGRRSSGSGRSSSKSSASSKSSSSSGSSTASLPTPDQALAAAMKPTSTGKIETTLNKNYGVDSSLQSLYDSIMRNHSKRLNNLKGNL